MGRAGIDNNSNVGIDNALILSNIDENNVAQGDANDGVVYNKVLSNGLSVVAENVDGEAVLNLKDNEDRILSVSMDENGDFDLVYQNVGEDPVFLELHNDTTLQFGDTQINLNKADDGGFTVDVVDDHQLFNINSNQGQFTEPSEPVQLPEEGLQENISFLKFTNNTGSGDASLEGALSKDGEQIMVTTQPEDEVLSQDPEAKAMVDDLDDLTDQLLEAMANGDADQFVTLFLMIALLMIKMSTELKGSSREAAQAHVEAAKRDIENAADAIVIGASTQFALSVTGAVTSMGMSFAGLSKMSGKLAKTTNDKGDLIDKPLEEYTFFDKLTKSTGNTDKDVLAGQINKSIGDSLAALISTSGGFGKAFFDAESKKSDGDATVNTAIRDMYKEGQDSFKDLVSQLFNVVQQVIQNESQALRKVWN